MKIKEENDNEKSNHWKLWTQEPENFDEEVKSLGTAWRPLTFIPFILCFFFTFKLIEISKEENEHDVIEEMEDRCCGSPGL